MLGVVRGCVIVAVMLALVPLVATVWCIGVLVGRHRAGERLSRSLIAGLILLGAGAGYWTWRWYSAYTSQEPTIEHLPVPAIALSLLALLALVRPRVTAFLLSFVAIAPVVGLMAYAVYADRTGIPSTGETGQGWALVVLLVVGVFFCIPSGITAALLGVGSQPRDVESVGSS